MAGSLVVSLLALLTVFLAALATAMVLPESIRLPTLFFAVSPSWPRACWWPAIATHMASSS
jgi:hypothetical protein